MCTVSALYVVQYERVLYMAGRRQGLRAHRPRATAASDRVRAPPTRPSRWRARAVGTAAAAPPVRLPPFSCRRSRYAVTSRLPTGVDHLRHGSQGPSAEAAACRARTHENRVADGTHAPCRHNEVYACCCQEVCRSAGTGVRYRVSLRAGGLATVCASAGSRCPTPGTKRARPIWCCVAVTHVPAPSHIVNAGVTDDARSQKHAPAGCWMSASETPHNCVVRLHTRRTGASHAHTYPGNIIASVSKLHTQRTRGRSQAALASDDCVEAQLHGARAGAGGLGPGRAYRRWRRRSQRRPLLQRRFSPGARWATR